MSRNFSIFLFLLVFLLSALLAIRISFFKLNSDYEYYFNVKSNVMVRRQTIEYRPWIGNILDTYEFNIKNGPKLYLIPLIFPEIRYRFPYQLKNVPLNSIASENLIKLKSNWSGDELISIRWIISPGVGSSVSYISDKGRGDYLQLNWPQTETALGSK